MLGKLIKHDFKSLSRVLLPTQLAVLGASILATIGFSVTFRADTTTFNENTLAVLLRIIAIFISGIMILGIIAASFLVAFIIYQRFYKSVMCDEGYLTFTLPVTTAQILWSKLITAVLWTLISLVTIFIGVNIFIMFTTNGDSFTNIRFYQELGRALSALTEQIGLRWIWPGFLFCVFILISTVVGILHVYLALVLGGVVTQKHRLLAGIGFYFAINIVQGTLMSVLQSLSMGTMMRRLEPLNGVQWGTDALSVYNGFMRSFSPYLWSMMLLMLALGVGYFLLCHYFLKNKLNLE